MLPALLILATIALVVLKVSGVLAIGWLVALLPAIVLAALWLFVAVVGLITVAVGSKALDRIDRL